MKPSYLGLITAVTLFLGGLTVAGGRSQGEHSQPQTPQPAAIVSDDCNEPSARGLLEMESEAAAIGDLAMNAVSPRAPGAADELYNVWREIQDRATALDETVRDAGSAAAALNSMERDQIESAAPHVLTLKSEADAAVSALRQDAQDVDRAVLASRRERVADAARSVLVAIEETAGCLAADADLPYDMTSRDPLWADPTWEIAMADDCVY